LYPGVGRVALLFPLRTLHGAAIGLFSTASAAMIADLSPPQRRGEGVGYFGISSNLGLALGPPLALAAIGARGFPAAFLLSAGAAAAALLTGALAGESAVPRPAVFSLRPAALLARGAVLPGIVMGAMAVSYGGLITLLALMGRARPLGNPGAFFTAAAACLVLTRFIAGPLSDRWGRGIVVVPGLMVEVLSMILLGVAYGPGLLVAAGAVYGIGYGAAQTGLMALAVDRVGAVDRARAMSTYLTGWEMGIGLGGYGLALLLPWVGFTGVFLGAALCAALGLLGYLLAPGRPPLLSRPHGAA
jgi:MFS family permease